MEIEFSDESPEEARIRQESQKKARDHAALVAGLGAMSTDYDRLLFDFATAAGQIAGDPDAPQQIRGMIEFALAYRRYGLEVAEEVLEENSGVEVNITYGQDGQPKRETPGILVGIMEARQVLRPRDKMFDGVAVITDARGREQFVAVLVKPNGDTQLHGDQYDYSRPDLIARVPIESIFPSEVQRRRI